MSLKYNHAPILYKIKASRCQGEEKIFTQRNGISGPEMKHFTLVF